MPRPTRRPVGLAGIKLANLQSQCPDRDLGVQTPDPMKSRVLGVTVRVFGVLAPPSRISDGGRESEEGGIATGGQVSK